MYKVIALLICLGVSAHARDLGGGDVTLFMKANDKIDIDALKQIKYTDSVYKVRNILKPSEMNYAMILKGFTSDAERDAEIAKIKNLPFVEKSEAINMKPDFPRKITYANMFMKAARALNKIVQFLPNRPLKKQVPAYVKCITVDMPADKEMYLISYMQVRNESAVMSYGWKLMTRLLPVLNLEFLYMGTPDSEKWSSFNLQKYDSKNTFCEYMESEAVIEYGPLFMKAYADQYTFSGLKV